MPHFNLTELVALSFAAVVFVGMIGAAVACFHVAGVL